jgi:DNA-directed RNA polymerase subunit F
MAREWEEHVRDEEQAAYDAWFTQSHEELKQAMEALLKWVDGAKANHSDIAPITPKARAEGRAVIDRARAALTNAEEP